MFNKKIKKLFKNPKLYFKDFYLKRKENWSSITPLKASSEIKFSIVSACFNVERYIDDFIKSLVHQRLNFRRNIFLILVDDGSTDRTKEKILKWVKRYPNNIKYVYQENQGQGCARNTGLDYVKTDWVTFTDPDDFLHVNYFYNIAQNLNNSNVDYIATNLIFYYEDSKKIVDGHKLNYKFKKEKNLVKIKSLTKELSLSMASSFFKMAFIRFNNLRVNENIKPNFEDGHFISQYFECLDNNESLALFLKKSIYYYRKRASKSSTVDTANKDVRHYSNVLEYGYLDILNKFKGKSLSLYTQNTVLYDLFWDIKSLVNNPERICFLTEEQKENYISLLEKCFNLIDNHTILKFNLIPGFWLYYKLGIINRFKNCMDGYNDKCYITDYDPIKDEIELLYFSSSVNSFEKFYIGKNEILPSYTKRITDDFLGKIFLIQNKIYIPLSSYKDEECYFYVNKKRFNFNIKNTEKQSFKCKDIRSYFKDKLVNCSLSKGNQNIWLIYDRVDHADDNAEHFYRYVKNNHPEIEAYFLLKKSSKDWKRLKDENFNLIEFGSKEHRNKLAICSKIISSHIDLFVTDYFKDKSSEYKQIIFLQHGIISTDMSRWLNTKKKIDIFSCETPDEFNSIVNDNTRYKFSEKNVKLLGLTRHDELLRKSNEYKVKKQILVQPTWRNYIVSANAFNKKVSINQKFFESEYIQKWGEFLFSPKLKELVEKYNYELVFCPHLNIVPYLKYWNLPSFIKILDIQNLSFQKLFSESCLMITDYSSVAFEFAFLNKPVLYYQFDYHTVIEEAAHSYQKGYFDYNKDAFGPISYESDILLKNLENYLINDCKNNDEYQQRLDRTFIYKDGNNCKRTFNAILDLDKSYQEDWINSKVADEYLEKAINNNDFNSINFVIEKIINHSDNNFKYNSSYYFEIKKVIDGFIALKEDNEYSLYLDSVDLSKIPNKLKENILEEILLYSLANADKDLLLKTLRKYWKDISEHDLYLYFYLLLQNYEKHPQQEDFNAISKHLSIYACSSSLLTYEDFITNNFSKILNTYNENCNLFKSRISLLLCSIIACKVNDFNLEGSIRGIYRNIFGKDDMYCLISAYRASVDGRVSADNDVWGNLQKYNPKFKFIYEFINDFINSSSNEEERLKRISNIRLLSE